jgi:hypothetical protein
MELRWRPDTCAYCNGTGEINMTIDKNVPVDMSYLTVDIGEDERNRIIKRDTQALARAQIFDADAERFIAQILYLYTIGKLNVDQIVEFYFVSTPKDEESDEIKLDWREYIEKVIREKTR